MGFLRPLVVHIVTVKTRCPVRFIIPRCSMEFVKYVWICVDTE